MKPKPNPTAKYSFTTKTEIDSGQLIYDKENNRFAIMIYVMPWYSRLHILFTGRWLIALNNASLLFYKLGKSKNEDTPNR